MSHRYDGIVMFSGGLDSIAAVHLLKSQGLTLLALHYVLPFYSGLGFHHRKIRESADALGIPLKIIEEGDAFFRMVQSPRFGFGKNANPCLDCRIHRLSDAAEVMRENGASFIATGEVIGQRPKSQRKSCLDIIDTRTGLNDRILRPLSALLLPPTEAERNGLVDRNKLLGISGRSRNAQIVYAKANGLQYPSPAGGCILTNIASAQRYLKLVEKYSPVDLEDFKLIAYGRHFAINERCRLVIARDDRENTILEKIISDTDLVFDLEDVPGPMGIGRGSFNEDDTATAASFVTRYSRARNRERARVGVTKGTGEKKVIEVTPATASVCEALRI